MTNDTCSLILLDGALTGFWGVGVCVWYVWGLIFRPCNPGIGERISFSILAMCGTDVAFAEKRNADRNILPEGNSSDRVISIISNQTI